MLYLLYISLHVSFHVLFYNFCLVGLFNMNSVIIIIIIKAFLTFFESAAVPGRCRQNYCYCLFLVVPYLVYLGCVFGLLLFPSISPMSPSFGHL